MSGPLEDLRIVDLSRIVAGPLATQILSDYGKIASRIDEYQANALTIEDACNSAIKTYQVHNEQVRNTPPPGYFGTRFGLRQREDLTSKTALRTSRKRTNRPTQLNAALESLEERNGPGTFLPAGVPGGVVPPRPAVPPAGGLGGAAPAQAASDVASRFVRSSPRGRPLAVLTVALW
jgi:hypothetical protein